MNASEAPTPTPSADGAGSPLVALGQRLRQAREERGLSVSALSGQLRMGEEQLAALESGDRARLPELVFVIAQARRVADALGCDVNALLAPLKQESSNSFMAAPAPLSATQQAPRERRTGRITAQSYTHKPARSAATGGGWRWLASLALVAGLAAAGSWGWLQRDRLLQLAGAVNSKPTSRRPAPAQPPKPAKPAPAAVALPVNTAKLKAIQPSWLEVRNGSGKQLFEGTFKGERTFPLSAGLQLLAGRPDLVTISLGNKPARPLGRIDQIQWVSVKAPAR